MVRPAVTIVNRIFPPIHGVTGESADELARYLESEGADVSVVYVNGSHCSTGEATAESNAKVHTVRAIYSGKRKYLRILSTFIESFLLIWKTRRVHRDGTIVLMTDPPFLGYWASWLLPKKFPTILWSMDLYPEAFAASGLVSKSSFVYHHHMRRLKRHPPSALIALGPLQSEIAAREAPAIPTVILPCGVTKSTLVNGHLTDSPDWYRGRDTIHFGYCGNLGEAHSVTFLTKAFEQIKNSDHCLVLALYGTKSNEVLGLVGQHPNIVVLDWVDPQSLRFIDIHLISLDSKWTGLSVPSKAVSSVCLGGSFLFCGSKESDTWKMLGDAGWIVDDMSPLEPQMKSFFETLTQDSVSAKKQHARRVGERLLEQQSNSQKEIAKLVFDYAAQRDPSSAA